MAGLTESEVDGSEVLRWLKEVGREAALPVLVGCGLDNQIDDDLLAIETIDHDNSLICHLGKIRKRIPPAVLARSSVVDTRPGQPLCSAVDAIKSPEEIALGEQKAAVRELGLTPEMIAKSTNPRVLVDAMADHKSGRLPAMHEQQDRYEAFKTAGLLTLGAQVIERWREISLRERGRVDGSILIKLAYCLRHSGDTEKALRATDPAATHDPTVSLPQDQKCILATERAAILLDLYWEKRDPDLLVQARASADMASGIAGSPEIEQVYRRLETSETAALR